MKDNDKVELTVEAVKRAAEKCGTAKEILKELFPEVFKVSPPEWEDVTGRVVLESYDITEVATRVEASGKYECPFKLVFNDRSDRVGEYRENYKLGSGRIWRRKSQ